MMGGCALKGSIHKESISTGNCSEISQHNYFSVLSENVLASIGEKVPQKDSVQNAGSFTSMQRINVISAPILPDSNPVLSEVTILPVSFSDQSKVTVLPDSVLASSSENTGVVHSSYSPGHRHKMSEADTTSEDIRMPKLGNSEVSSDDQGCPDTSDSLLPNPIAEDNRDWNLMVHSIAANRIHNKQS